MSFGRELLLSENVCTAFHELTETVGNLQRKPFKCAKLMYESPGYPITGIGRANWIPAIGHTHDHTLITWQIGVRRTNHD